MVHSLTIFDRCYIHGLCSKKGILPVISAQPAEVTTFVDFTVVPFTKNYLSFILLRNRGPADFVSSGFYVHTIHKSDASQSENNNNRGKEMTCIHNLGRRIDFF